MKTFSEYVLTVLTESKKRSLDYLIGQEVRIMKGSARGQLGKIVDVDYPDEDNDTFQFHVKNNKTGKVHYLDFEDTSISDLRVFKGLPK